VVYELPDGKKIQLLERDLLACQEPFFDSQLIPGMSFLSCLRPPYSPRLSGPVFFLVAWVPLLLSSSLLLSSQVFLGFSLVGHPHFLVLLGKDLLSLPEMITNAIMVCGLDIRKHMLSNLVLCGGASLARGFPERLKTEMIELWPPSLHVDVVAPGEQERKCSSWIGSSITGSFCWWGSFWYNKEMYLDSGGPGIHRMCW
jgi:hypothetical protein